MNLPTDLGTSQPAVILGVILVGVILSLLPQTRYIPQLFTTITHEFGHGISVIPFGGRLKGMKLSLNTEGEAVVMIPQYRWPFYQCLRILNLLAGYSAPIYFSIFVLAAALNNWILAMFWFMVVFIVMMVLFIRNWSGALIVFVFTLLTILLMFVLPVFTPYMIFLASCSLVCGSRDIIKAMKYALMPRDKAPHTDFHIASEELRMPPFFWAVTLLVVHIPIWGFLVYLILQNSPTIQ